MNPVASRILRHAGYGGAMGGIIGGVTTKDPKKRRQNMAVGAVRGATLGGLYGSLTTNASQIRNELQQAKAVRRADLHVKHDQTLRDIVKEEGHDVSRMPWKAHVPGKLKNASAFISVGSFADEMQKILTAR